MSSWHVWCFPSQSDPDDLGHLLALGAGQLLEWRVFTCVLGFLDRDDVTCLQIKYRDCNF